MLLIPTESGSSAAGCDSGAAELEKGKEEGEVGKEGGEESNEEVRDKDEEQENDDGAVTSSSAVSKMTNPPSITPPHLSSSPSPPSVAHPSPGREGRREGLSFKEWDELCRIFEGVLSLEALHSVYEEAEGLEGALKVGREGGGRRGGEEGSCGR